MYYVLYTYFIIWYPGMPSDDCYTKAPGLYLKPLSHKSKDLKARLLYESIESQELNLNIGPQSSTVSVFSPG